MGVLFFIVNVVFAIIILFMCLWASIRALMSKNPETRYQPMRDDRGSFIKSSTNLAQTTELDALGATARGDVNGQRGSGYYAQAAEQKRMDIEDEDESLSSSLAVNQAGQPQHRNSGYGNGPQGYGGYGAGYNKEAYVRSESPYSNAGPWDALRGGGSGSGFPSRTASPANNMWQRGVGY
jgi:hypothetical protein